MNVRRTSALVYLAVLMLAPHIAFPAALSPNTCADGRVDRVLEDFDSTPISAFTVFKADPSIPNPALAVVAGCKGQALSFGYDLTNTSPDGQSWIVLQRSIPATKLTNFTHIRLALRGSNLNSHETVDVKLWDGIQLYAISLGSLTDLPAWRPIYIDLRELSNQISSGATISRFEVAVARCSSDCEVPDVPGSTPSNDHAGTLFLDEFSLVDLTPGAVNRLVESGFESVEPNRSVALRAAEALLAKITSSGAAAGLIPAWFPETSPNYNTYVLAEALLVFTYEYERSGNPAFRDAARTLARKLLSLQIPAGRINSGAWYTAYDQALQPPTRPLPAAAPGGQPRCDGNETMVLDRGQLVADNIDGCEWVGNVGWALIALGKLQRSGFYDDPAALSAAVNSGAAWIIGQTSRHAGYPRLISLGIEGNTSAYFGLLAAGKKAEAELLGNAVFQSQSGNPTLQSGWDSLLQRMRPGVGTVYATALDVSGSWGVSLLRSIGKTREALDSQGYTATLMRTSSFDGSIAGYGDIAGPFTVAIEFAAQAAVAGIKDADYVMRQIYPLQISSGPYAGAFPGCTDHWYGGALAPWCTSMPGVSPTAWMYYAASNIDPLWEAYQATLSAAGVVPFKVANRGTSTRTTPAGTDAIKVVYGRVAPDVPDTTPSGTAIIGFRPAGTLISETTVPASDLVTSGRIYAESSAAVQTGVAIANPNNQAATVSFTYTSLNGSTAGIASVIIPANNQIAAFLNEPQYNAPPQFTGTVTFTSTQPVGVIAIRGFTNERSEFLLTTLPVVPLTASTGSLLVPHFATGGGWTTQIVLVNPTSQSLSGSVQFLGTDGMPVSVTMDGQTGTTFGYAVPGSAAQRLRVTGGVSVLVGSVRIVPGANPTPPAGLLVFSFDKQGVRTSEAAIPLVKTGSTFRMHAETAGDPSAQRDSLQIGLAIANNAASTIAVNLQLFDVFGNLVRSGSVSISPNGQTAFFIDQVPGLGPIPLNFQGMLTVSGPASGIAVCGLRGRYNERGDFLITTSAPIEESTPLTTAERSFPHLVQGGGYTSEVVVFSAPSGQSGSGIIRFFTQSGQLTGF